MENAQKKIPLRENLKAPNPKTPIRKGFVKIDLSDYEKQKKSEIIVSRQKLANKNRIQAAKQLFEYIVKKIEEKDEHNVPGKYTLEALKNLKISPHFKAISKLVTYKRDMTEDEFKKYTPELKVDLARFNIKPLIKIEPLFKQPEIPEWRQPPERQPVPVPEVKETIFEQDKRVKKSLRELAKERGPEFKKKLLARRKKRLAEKEEDELMIALTQIDRERKQSRLGELLDSQVPVKPEVVGEAIKAVTMAVANEVITREQVKVVKTKAIDVQLENQIEQSVRRDEQQDQIIPGAQDDEDDNLPRNIRRDEGYYEQDDKYEQRMQTERAINQQLGGVPRSKKGIKEALEDPNLTIIDTKNGLMKLSENPITDTSVVMEADLQINLFEIEHDYIPYDDTIGEKIADIKEEAMAQFEAGMEEASREIAGGGGTPEFVGDQIEEKIAEQNNEDELMVSSLIEPKEEQKEEPALGLAGLVELENKKEEERKEAQRKATDQTVGLSGLVEAEQNEQPMELPIAKINKYSELDDISKVKRERDVLSEGYVPTDLRDIQYMNPEVIAQYLTRPNPNLPRYADDFEEFDPIVPATMLRDDVSTVLKEARLNLTREQIKERVAMATQLLKRKDESLTYQMYLKRKDAIAQRKIQVIDKIRAMQMSRMGYTQMRQYNKELFHLEAEESKPIAQLTMADFIQYDIQPPKLQVSQEGDIMNFKMTDEQFRKFEDIFDKFGIAWPVYYEPMFKGEAAIRELTDQQKMAETLQDAINKAERRNHKFVKLDTVVQQIFKDRQTRNAFKRLTFNQREVDRISTVIDNVMGAKDTVEVIMKKMLQLNKERKQFEGVLKRNIKAKAYSDKRLTEEQLQSIKDRIGPLFDQFLKVKQYKALIEEFVDTMDIEMRTAELFYKSFRDDNEGLHSYFVAGFMKTIVLLEDTLQAIKALPKKIFQIEDFENDADNLIQASEMISNFNRMSYDEILQTYDHDTIPTPILDAKKMMEDFEVPKIQLVTDIKNRSELDTVRRFMRECWDDLLFDLGTDIYPYAESIGRKLIGVSVKVKNRGGDLDPAVKNIVSIQHGIFVIKDTLAEKQGRLPFRHDFHEIENNIRSELKRINYFKLGKDFAHEHTLRVIETVVEPAMRKHFLRYDKLMKMREQVYKHLQSQVRARLDMMIEQSFIKLTAEFFYNQYYREIFNRIDLSRNNMQSKQIDREKGKEIMRRLQTLTSEQPTALESEARSNDKMYNTTLFENMEKMGEYGGVKQGKRLKTQYINVVSQFLPGGVSIKPKQKYTFVHKLRQFSSVDLNNLTDLDGTIISFLQECEKWNYNAGPAGWDSMKKIEIKPDELMLSPTSTLNQAVQWYEAHAYESTFFDVKASLGKLAATKDYAFLDHAKITDAVYVVQYQPEAIKRAVEFAKRVVETYKKVKPNAYDKIEAGDLIPVQNTITLLATKAGTYGQLATAANYEELAEAYSVTGKDLQDKMPKGLFEMLNQSYQKIRRDPSSKPNTQIVKYGYLKIPNLQMVDKITIYCPSANVSTLQALTVTLKGTMQVKSSGYDSKILTAMEPKIASRWAIRLNPITKELESDNGEMAAKIGTMQSVVVAGKNQPSMKKRNRSALIASLIIANAPVVNKFSMAVLLLSKVSDINSSVLREQLAMNMGPVISQLLSVNKLYSQRQYADRQLRLEEIKKKMLLDERNLPKSVRDSAKRALLSAFKFISGQRRLNQKGSLYGVKNVGIGNGVSDIQNSLSHLVLGTFLGQIVVLSGMLPDFQIQSQQIDDSGAPLFVFGGEMRTNMFAKLNVLGRLRKGDASDTVLRGFIDVAISLRDSRSLGRISSNTTIGQNIQAALGLNLRNLGDTMEVVMINNEHSVESYARLYFQNQIDRDQRVLGVMAAIELEIIETLVLLGHIYNRKLFKKAKDSEFYALIAGVIFGSLNAYSAVLEQVQGVAQTNEGIIKTFKQKVSLIWDYIQPPRNSARLFSNVKFSSRIGYEDPDTNPAFINGMLIELGLTSSGLEKLESGYNIEAGYRQNDRHYLENREEPVANMSKEEYESMVRALNAISVFESVKNRGLAQQVIADAAQNAVNALAVYRSEKSDRINNLEGVQEFILPSDHVRARGQLKDFERKLRLNQSAIDSYTYQNVGRQRQSRNVAGQQQFGLFDPEEIEDEEEQKIPEGGNFRSGDTMMSNVSGQSLLSQQATQLGKVIEKRAQQQQANIMTRAKQRLTSALGGSNQK